MADEANDELESKNQPSEEDVKTDEVEDEDAQSDSEDLEALQEKNKRLFERAKKAEAEAKLLKAERLKKEEQAKAAEAPKAPAPPEKQGDGLTHMDTIALIEAKVTNKEDITEVLDYAKYKGISVSDALNSDVVKTILKDKAEYRATANATNTSAARRGTAKPSADAILDKASQGQLPDDPDDLAEARFQSKKTK